MIEWRDVDDTLGAIERRGFELARAAEKYRDAGDAEAAEYALKMRDQLYDAWNVIYDDAKLAGFMGYEGDK